MTPILSRARARAFDAHAIAVLGVSGLVLMENAGRGAAEIALRMLAGAGGVAKTTTARVVVVAGLGNNGGDGFVVARHLVAAGVADVRVVLVGREALVRGDARVQLETWRALGGALETVTEDEPRALEAAVMRALSGATLIVDALFGTGLDRPLGAASLAVVEAMNARTTPTLALDLPSGLDADRGAIFGACVRADETACFGTWKLGLLTPNGALWGGRRTRVELGFLGARAVEAADVGFDATLIELCDVATTLGRRPVDAHKYRAGAVLVIAGSAGKQGAAALCARGVLRGGAGLVSVASRDGARDGLLAALPEAMTVAIDRASIATAAARAGAIVVGPGMGLDDAAVETLLDAVTGCSATLVLDADALTLLARSRPGEALFEAVRARAGANLPTILTPHTGECARLLATTSAHVDDDRFAAALALAETTGAIAVLKGAHTIVASSARGAFVNATGNALLAVAGSGDVLAGVMAAFACRRDAFDAACAAVAVHGLAAERLASSGIDRGVLAHEIADAIAGAVAHVGVAPSPRRSL